MSFNLIGILRFFFQLITIENFEIFFNFLRNNFLSNFSFAGGSQLVEIFSNYQKISISKKNVKFFKFTLPLKLLLAHYTYFCIDIYIYISGTHEERR